MKQIGRFTSIIPGQSSKTQSEEFREAVEKEKHRKRILTAASRGEEKKLQTLLDKHAGTDLNAKPLMAAATNGKLAAVKLLLTAGADPYVKDKRGLMALDLARKNKHKDVVEYLLNNMGDQEIFKILKGLGFARYWEPFVTQQISLDQFKQFTDTDYDRMGLPIGPRKQIQRYWKDLEEKAETLRSPRAPRDGLPSPRGRSPNGAAALSATLAHNYVEVPPIDQRTLSSPQMALDPPRSPRDGPGSGGRGRGRGGHSIHPSLSASSPSAVVSPHPHPRSATDGGDGDRDRDGYGRDAEVSNAERESLSPYGEATGLGSSASSTATGRSPRTPRSKAAQYVDYDKFDQEVDSRQQQSGNNKKKASGDADMTAVRSPAGKKKETSAGKLGDTERRLMGQYVDYEKADFSSETTTTTTATSGGGVDNNKKGSPTNNKKKGNEDEDANYIYGGVGDLPGGEEQKTDGQKQQQPQQPATKTNKPVESDSDSSSDDDDDDDETESESDSDEDVSSDEGPGDERKYGYREIDYEELVFGKKIGAGAFGSVYKGTWRGAPVAIKKLKNFNIKDKHMVEEFRREAKLAELVHNHPNVVKFVGACSKRKGKFCLVTMFCAGGSLDKILRDPSVKISLQTTVRMAVEAASGLYHLHCEGVIHRDIAARNCLVGENFHIFVTDFGFARIKENATAEYARTLNAVGPVKHMSPEAMREKKYSEKSDAFSFGVLLWEMFTRKEPYEGEKDLVALAFRIAVQGYRLSIPSSIPAPIALLMKDCWATDPHERPNFKEILKRLSTFANSLDD